MTYIHTYVHTYVPLRNLASVYILAAAGAAAKKSPSAHGTSLKRIVFQYVHYIGTVTVFHSACDPRLILGAKRCAPFKAGDSGKVITQSYGDEVSIYFESDRSNPSTYSGFKIKYSLGM